MNLLGIYIPTYNRARELEECLYSFIHQIKKYNFPIYISDNCSTDNTEEVVKKLQKNYPNIYYSKNGKNLLYPPNVVKVLSMGNTKYVWLFSDDDTIYENAIDEIIKYLEKNNDYLIINADVYSQKLDHIIKKTYLDISLNRQFTGENSHNDAILTLGQTGYQGFNPHMIIKKDIIDKEMKSLDPYAPNMDFIHTIAYYKGIVGKIGIVIAKPLIKNRGGNLGYSKRIMEIYFKSWDLTHDILLESYSKYIIDEVRRRTLFNLCIPMTIDKIMNHSESHKNYATYIKSNKNLSQSQKLILKLVLYVPRPIHMFLYEGYKKAKKY